MSLEVKKSDGLNRKFLPLVHIREGALIFNPDLINSLI